MPTLIEFANVCKLITASMLSEREIINDYYRIPALLKKKYAHAIDKVVRELTVPFDVGQPRLVVELHCLGSKLNVNPAVLLMAYFSEKK